MSRRVAVIGGGIAGVTAAWQLHRLGQEFTLYEASHRLGGTVQTMRRGGFLIEGGPDGWVSEKPWARELAVDLGLESELIPSNDADRVTYILQRGKLVAMPDGMRMMVPTDLSALAGSPLFSEAALLAYAAEPARAAELIRTAPTTDESIADFILRHFGEEVLRTVGAPLLSGVFGGDVHTLSVRAVMPKFVELARDGGSLVTALAGKGNTARNAIFTTLRSGLGTLIDRMVSELPTGSLRMSTPVTSLVRKGEEWLVSTSDCAERFDAVFLAVPVSVARTLLAPIEPQTTALLAMETTSAVLCALAFRESFELPRGFGFLAPEGEGSKLLAGTFSDQKYDGRVTPGCRLLRGFFGGELARELVASTDEEIAALTLVELRKLLGTLPEPAFSVVSRWPDSLPQYAVGHLERMTELDALIAGLPGLHLLGNPYRGVGLPDIIRDARAAALAVAARS